MFISDEDYRVVIGENALRVISQVSGDNRSNAEAEAVEEIASYLRPKYDTRAIFAASGSERNKIVVMYTCDIALYHMAASAPQKMGIEIRKERYERAVRWLIQLCKGVKVIHFQAANPSPRFPQEALPAHGHRPWAAAPG